MGSWISFPSLEDHDLDRFGDILVQAHRDIATNFEASCPQLDYVVETAVEHGAYGARLTGAGWGGAAIALIDADSAPEFADSLQESYRDRFPDLEPHFT